MRGLQEATLLPGPAPAVQELRVEPGMKGLPCDIEPFPLQEIGTRGWNVLRGDLPFPVALLRESALEHNSWWMRRFLEATGASILPHGKTTMSPQLFHRQLADGALGITVATVHQLRVCHEHGIRRVFLANQLVDRRGVEWTVELLRRDPTFDLSVLVDSSAGVERLAAGVRDGAPGRPLPVFLEVGFQGGRTGCRTPDDALEVAAAVQQAGQHLVLRGVSGFEGIIQGADDADTEARVEAFVDFLVEMASECLRRGWFGVERPVLSAAGSSFHDLVAARLSRAGIRPQVEVWLRSGCYLTHDSGMYAAHFRRLAERSPGVAALGEGPRAALEVWSVVQSRPEPGWAYLGMGKRDCSFDAGLPRPLRWFRPGEHDEPHPLGDEVRVRALNDQHAYLELSSDSPLRVGDLVACGISHPCTTFDRWSFLPVVNDRYDVVDGIRTFFG